MLCFSDITVRCNMITLGSRKTLLFLLVSCTVYVECTIQPVVTTPLGEIQGSFLTTRLGKTINAFRGIRYADAPIGALRFQVRTYLQRK